MAGKKHWKLLFWIYCAGMLALLFWRIPNLGPGPYGERISEMVNLVPFETVRRYIRLLGTEAPVFVRLAVVNLLGNIVMFVPLGLLMPAAYPGLGRWWKVLITTGGAVVAVELTQMLTLLGTCDIDDLILNLLGAAMGYGLFLILRNIKGSAAK